MLLETQRFPIKNQSVENSLKGEIKLLKELCISLISNVKHMSFDGEGQHLAKSRVKHYHKQS